MRCARCDEEAAAEEAIGCSGCGVPLHGSCAANGCPNRACHLYRHWTHGRHANRLVGQLVMTLVILVGIGVTFGRGPGTSGLPRAAGGGRVPGVDGPRLVAEARALLARAAGVPRSLGAGELDSTPYLREVASGGVSFTGSGLALRLGFGPRADAVVVLAPGAAGAFPSPSVAELEALEPPASRDRRPLRAL